MRSRLFFAVSLLVLCWSATGCQDQSTSNPFVLPEPVYDTAILRINFNIFGRNGYRMLYIQGRKSTGYIHEWEEIDGVLTKTSIVVNEPERITVYDLLKGTAMWFGNPDHYIAEMYEKLSPEEKKQVLKNARENGGFVGSLILGPEAGLHQGTFLGKPVDIYKAGEFTFYRWREGNLLLNMSGKLGDKDFIQEAVSLETDVPLPEEALELPAKIKVEFDQKQDQQQREMATDVMDKYKSPEFGKKDADK